MLTTLRKSIISLSLLLLPFCMSAMEQQQMPPAGVSVTLAQQRLLAPTSPIAGSVASLNDSQISSQVAGELLWIAEVGSEVQENDVIARIENTLLKSDFINAQASLEKMRADLVFRQQEVNRIKSLARRDNTSKARLEEEKAKLAMLKQDIRGAEADLVAAQFNLAHTEIKAPFAGHVVDRLANKGEYLAKGEHIIRLVDTLNKQVIIHAPLNLMLFNRVNNTVSVQANEQLKKLSIAAIVPVADKVSRMVEIRLSAKESGWPVGTPVMVNLPNTQALSRVSIPRDALVIKGSDIFVFRIDQAMKAERIKANIEAIDDPWVSIGDVLKVGDQIVIRGGERLMPGQQVTLLKNK